MASYIRTYMQLPRNDLQGYSDPSFPRRVADQVALIFEELDTLQGVFGGTALYVSSGSFGLATGTQGGIPYFSSGTSLSSSTLLGRNQVLVGGGSTGSPATLAMPSLASVYALTATTGSALPIWTLATATATGDALVLRHSDGGAAFTSLTATTLTATAGTFTGAINAQGATFTSVNMTTLTATAATLTGGANISGGVTISNGLIASGGMTLTGTFNAGAATFSGAINAQGATFAAVQMATLTATAGTFSGVVNAGSGLVVAGATTLVAVAAATLTATAATFSGGVNMTSGATISGTSILANATITGVLNAQGATFTAVQMATLTATAATFSGSINAQGATFTGVNASNLSVTGASTLAAVGMATLTATAATFSAGVNFGSGVTVSGVANLGAVTITGALHAVGVTVTGVANLSAATVTGAFNANTGIFAAGVTISGTANLQAVTISGALNAAGATFSGVANFGAATFTGALNAAGATFSGVANFGAATFTGAIHGTNVTLTGTARVGGGFTVAGASTMAAVSMTALSAATGSFSGNMAIGTTNLDIGVLGANYRILTIYNATSQYPPAIVLATVAAASANTDMGLLNFYNGVTLNATIYARSDGANTDSGQFILYTKATGSALAEALRINSSQTVRLSGSGYTGNGTVSTSGGNGTLTTASDERLKRVQGPYEPGLADVLKVKPIRYKWRHDIPEAGFTPEQVYAGFSAQNVRDALGDLAVGRRKDGMLSLQDRAILGALVNAVKELSADKAALEARLAALEGKVK